MNKLWRLFHVTGTLLMGLLLLSSLPLRAQDESTVTGRVASSTRNTVTVREDTGRYHLFVFDRNTNKPASVPVGSQVRIVSVAGDEPNVRLAREVTITQEAGTGGQQTTGGDVIPSEVRQIERQIERQVRRFRGGVRAGAALDPEMILIGVQAQVGPFFHPDVYFRPNVEFAWGEVTTMFALNPDIIFRLPVSSRTGRWSTYVGVGPGFNFLHQNFEAEEGGDRIDFGDFKSDLSLNILGGLQYRGGMFVELRTSVYSQPSPTLRMVVGYNF